MKTTLTELKTIIKDIILEELDDDFDIPLPILRVKDFSDVSKNFTGIAKFPNGTKKWYKDGEFHREDGPAMELSDGTKAWYKNGKLHRENGPAIEYFDRTYPIAKEWWLNGQLHRENGPAVEYPDGRKYWYLNNKQYSKEKYDKIIEQQKLTESIENDDDFDIPLPVLRIKDFRAAKINRIYRK